MISKIQGHFDRDIHKLDILYTIFIPQVYHFKGKIELYAYYQ
jgi:hypothetical protein